MAQDHFRSRPRPIPPGTEGHLLAEVEGDRGTGLLTSAQLRQGGRQKGGIFRVNLETAGCSLRAGEWGKERDGAGECLDSGRVGVGIPTALR